MKKTIWPILISMVIFMMAVQNLSLTRKVNALEKHADWVDTMIDKQLTVDSLLFYAEKMQQSNVH